MTAAFRRIMIIAFEANVATKSQVSDLRHGYAVDAFPRGVALGVSGLLG